MASDVFLLAATGAEHTVRDGTAMGTSCPLRPSEKMPAAAADRQSALLGTRALAFGDASGSNIVDA